MTSRCRCSSGWRGSGTSPSTTARTCAATPAARPVRVGNDAWRQRQLDVPGEVVSAVWRLRDYLGETFDVELREMVLGLTEQVAAHLAPARPGHVGDPGRRAPLPVLEGALLGDHGPGGEARRPARRAGRPAALGRRSATRSVTRCCARGGTTGSARSPAPSARRSWTPRRSSCRWCTSCRPPTRGCAPPSRWSSGSWAREDGLVRRWPTDPAGFLLCSFWLVECLVMAGEQRRAAGAVRAGGRARQRPRPVQRADRPERRDASSATPRRRCRTSA